MLLEVVEKQRIHIILRIFFINAIKKKGVKCLYTYAAYEIFDIGLKKYIFFNI